MTRSLVLSLLLLVGCSSSSNTLAPDASADSGADATSVLDAGGDAGPDAALACMPALECSGFPTSGYATDATDVANCAGFVHRVDCCGKSRVFGINHGSRTTLCPAETACAAQYPAPPTCSDATITTDTNETTTNLGDVRVRCVPNGGATCQCETFLCTTGACLATSVVVGSCGP